MKNLNLKMLTNKIIFGECPRWRNNRLWFSDMKDHKIKIMDDSGNIETFLAINGDPGGFGWLPNGDILFASMLDHKLFRVNDTNIALVADLSDYCGGLLNDMVIDIHGNAFVGNIGFNHELLPIELKPTHILRVDAFGRISIAAKDILCPNGMAITCDGKTFLVGQSGSTELLAFNIDKKGMLKNRYIYAKLGDGVTYDGICADVENGIWIASPTSSEFLRVLRGGKVTHRIDVGDKIAVACMLGGRDRKTLYCITSSKELNKVEGFGCSSISSTRVEVAGGGWP